MVTSLKFLSSNPVFLALGFDVGLLAVGRQEAPCMQRIPIMENQMEKKLEDKMETGVIGILVYK